MAQPRQEVRQTDRFFRATSAEGGIFAFSGSGHWALVSVDNGWFLGFPTNNTLVDQAFLTGSRPDLTLGR
jgi:hypothetical protein